jgi:hypothetical protein
VFSIKPLVKAVIAIFLKARPDVMTKRPLARVVAAISTESESSALCKGQII